MRENGQMFLWKQTLTAAAEIPAVWAATGVDFLMFLKPSVPHDVRTIDCPALSVSWMCVLGARQGDRI